MYLLLAGCAMIQLAIACSAMCGSLEAVPEGPIDGGPCVTACTHEQAPRRLHGTRLSLLHRAECGHGDARVGVPDDRPPAAVGPLPQ